MTNPIGQEMAAAISDSNKTTFKKVKVTYIHWWQRLLAFCFLLPKNKRIIISDPFPATVYRLLSILIDLKVVGDEGDTEELNFYKILKGNIPLLTDFLAIGIHNKEGDPPHWLYTAIGNQLTAKEINDLTQDIYRRLDVETFFGILTSLRKVRELSHTLDPEAPTPL